MTITGGRQHEDWAAIYEGTKKCRAAKRNTHADGKEFPQHGSERECKVVPGTTHCANGK
jgi:hypothetical protein